MTKPTRFRPGDKVVLDGKVYDFGYIGRTDKAIIYEEGEMNMQDSIAVNPEELTLRRKESGLAQKAGSR